MKKFTFLSLILSVFLFSSCASIYIMSPQNVPGFKEAKETKMTANISIQHEDILSCGFNSSLSIAHSFTDKFAFIGGGSFLRGRNDSSGFYANIGLGYFKGFNNNFVFENYIGYGNGGTTGDFINTYPNFFRLRYHSLFNQASVTFKSPNKWFETAISLKFSQINHYKANNPSLYYEILHMEPISYLIEPSLIMRFGNESVKMEVFATILHTFNNTYKAVNETYHNTKKPFPYFSSGIGIVYKITKQKDKSIVP